MKQGMKDMILKWAGEGYSAAEIAKALAPHGIPRDEVESVIRYGAHGPQPKPDRYGPEFLEPMF